MKDTPKWRSANASDLHKWWGFWSMFILLPLTLLMGLWKLRSFQTKIDTNVAFARNRKAESVAQKQLKQAKKYYKAAEIKPFYEELSIAILGYFGNKLNIQEKGLTHQELDLVLKEKGLAVEIRTELISLLKEADAARFSPIQPTMQVLANALEKAERLINQGEEIKNAT